MIRYGFLCLNLFLSMWALEAASLEDVRLGLHPEKTRLVLDIKGYASIDPDTLQISPIHTSNIRLGAYEGRDYISSYTLSKSGNTLSVRMSCSQKTCHSKVLILSNPTRMVIDVYPVISSQSIHTSPQTITLAKAPLHIARKPKFLERITLSNLQEKNEKKMSSDRNQSTAFPGLELSSNQSEDIEEKSETTIAFQENAVKTSLDQVPVGNIPMPHIKPKIRTIVLDPGHGGKDPGTVAQKNLFEKNIVLQIARTIQEKSYQSGRPYNIRLTRDKDVYVPLHQRYEWARRQGADLFISLHADHHTNPKVRGISIYTLSEKASDKEAERLASQENKSDLVAGIDFSETSPEVSTILISLTQRETQSRSEQFAHLFTKSISAAVLGTSCKHRSASLKVLKAPDLPSVLIEVGYLSNLKDRINLQEKGYQIQLASRIIGAIDQYFKSEPL